LAFRRNQVIMSSAAGTASTVPASAEPPAKKKARRATGTLRKWTAGEEDLLRELVATLGQQKARRADFDGFAEKLNAWALREKVSGSARSGYAVEQRWQLYLKPDAPRAAKAVQVAPPLKLQICPPASGPESAARTMAQDATPPTAAVSAPSSKAAGKHKAVASPPSSKAAGKRKAVASPKALSDDQQQICWDPSTAELLLADGFDELAMEVAENVSMQAMSRMCRKGMGFRRTDDPRLRRAEHDIDPADEIAKLGRALAPIESAAAHLRPASLRAVSKALSAAWHEWRETDLTTAHRDYDPSGCLGEPWHHELEVARVGPHGTHPPPYGTRIPCLRPDGHPPWNPPTPHMGPYPTPWDPTCIRRRRPTASRSGSRACGCAR